MSNSILAHAIQCRACESIFVICKSCYHGHCYCSVSCRKTGYAKVHKEANDRYRQKRHAKILHSARAVRYRNRLLKKFVTDEGSRKIFSAVVSHDVLHRKLKNILWQAACSVCGKVWNQGSFHDGGSV